jgi:alkylation response protein AidB-like acyl-CoA dehydrogenase
MMTECSVNWMSDQDVGEAGDGRSNLRMDVAIEMVTAATCSATETAGATIFHTMETNGTGKQRRRSEAPAAPSGWRSCMVRTI